MARAETVRKAAGIDTIVDLTVIGTGRSIRRIARVAARTDVVSAP